MEIVLFLWLAGVSSSLSFVLGCLGIISVFGLGVLAIILYETDKLKLWKDTWWRIGASISIFAIIVSVLIPNKNTLYLMAGGYYGQKALQSETAGKVMTIINQHLDEKIKELTKEK